MLGGMVVLREAPAPIAPFRVINGARIASREECLAVSLHPSSEDAGHRLLLRRPSLSIERSACAEAHPGRCEVAACRPVRLLALASWIAPFCEELSAGGLGWQAFAGLLAYYTDRI